MASSSKKVASSTAEDSKFQVLELFPVPAFHLGKWVQPKTFANSSVEFVEMMKAIGWNEALSFHGAWYHDPYALFWNNAQAVGGTLVGDWEGNKIIISQDAIGKVLGVEAEVHVYNKDWEKVVRSYVDTTLYGEKRPDKDVASFLKASRMKPLWRLYHNLLFHIIFARRGGKDNVSSKDRFVLHNMSLKRKVNLSALILDS